MSQYKGYWFYGLRYNEIIQAKDLTDEYCLLNCPQEYDGPFRTEEEALAYSFANPTLHKDFLKSLKDMENFIYGNIY